MGFYGMYEKRWEERKYNSWKDIFKIRHQDPLKQGLKHRYFSFHVYPEKFQVVLTEAVTAVFISDKKGLQRLAES